MQKKKKERKRKLQVMAQLIAKLREREMRSATVLKKGSIVNRDDYRVRERLFLLSHLLLTKLGILFKSNSLCHKVNLFYLMKIMVDIEVNNYNFSLQIIDQKIT